MNSFTSFTHSFVYHHIHHHIYIFVFHTHLLGIIHYISCRKNGNHIIFKRSLSNFLFPFFLITLPARIILRFPPLFSLQNLFQSWISLHIIIHRHLLQLSNHTLNCPLTQWHPKIQQNKQKLIQIPKHTYFPFH